MKRILMSLGWFISVSEGLQSKELSLEECFANSPLPPTIREVMQETIMKDDKIIPVLEENCKDISTTVLSTWQNIKVEDVESYVNDLPTSQLTQFVDGVHERDMPDNSKKFILELVRLADSSGNNLTPQDEKELHEGFLKLSYLERVGVLKWIDSPQVGNENDDQLVLKRFLKEDELRNMYSLKNKIIDEVNKFMISLSLDDQFRVLTWINNPPSPKESETEVLQKLEENYNILKHNFSSLNEYIFQLPAKERLVAFKWRRQKMSEKTKKIEDIFDLDLQKETEEMCIIF